MDETPEEIAVNIEELEQVYSIVNSEFVVEEHFIERGIPTFHIKEPQNLKQAFLKLVKKLDPTGFIPVLREKNGETVIRVVSKPPVKPSRPIINVILFLATIGTTFLTGYFLSLGLVEDGYMSNPLIGGATFTVAIMAILGCHEMGHKFAADQHSVEATFPYFIPGPPPQMGGFGTFGAVIQQKSLAPNKDALFDIG
ncbi:MAG: site-2 protease family protein, partial [Thermoproteota archaeon]|nr:site-2 protease family protein [Thermoproteota archaeon]